jgi:hypothetical protein
VLLGGRYGRRLHFWDLHSRKHLQTIDFGDKYQLVFELRPAHDPTKAYGFVNCVVSLENLSSSIWTWYKDGDKWAGRKVIEIPAEPASEDQLPPLLKGFKAVPPLVTDIDLSMDDRFLYVACWGIGDLQQYDVSDPFNPKLAGATGMDMRRTMLVVAAIGSFAPWPLMSVVSARAADDAPPQSGAFLAYCKTNREGCSDKIADINFAMMVTAPINRKWCPGADTTGVDSLTPKVVQWLTAHPETNSKTTNEAIELAVIRLYPCKR